MDENILLNTNQRVVNVNNRNVYIHDKLLEHKDIIYLEQYAINSLYKHSNKDYLDVDKPVDYKWVCELTEEESRNIGLLDNIVRLPFFNSYSDIMIHRQYINCSTFDVIDRIHTDYSFNNKDKELKGDVYTALYYGNSVWQPDWFGETHFYNDDLSEIALSIMPKPGRLVIFDGAIPHSARTPSRGCPYPRYTYATKLFLKNNTEN